LRRPKLKQEPNPPSSGRPPASFTCSRSPLMSAPKPPCKP
jgi:hypothetical protein